MSNKNKTSWFETTIGKKTVRKKTARKVAKASTRKVAKKTARKVAKKTARKSPPVEHLRALKPTQHMPGSVIDRINAHAAGKNPIPDIGDLVEERYSKANVVGPSTTQLGGIRPSAKSNEVYVPREELDKRYINWTKNDIATIRSLRKKGHSVRSLRLVFGTSWAPIARVMAENGIK